MGSPICFGRGRKAIFCFRSRSRWETYTRYDAVVWVRGSLAVARRLGRGCRVEDLFEPPGGCFMRLFFSGELTHAALPRCKKHRVSCWQGLLGREGHWGPRTFVADETDLECANLIAAHVCLLVLVAEDVQLDLVDPDAVLGLAGEPAARGRLVGYWYWGSVRLHSGVGANERARNIFGSPQRTESGPDWASPQLAVPHCGVEAHPSRPVVFVDYQGVLVVVIDDLSGYMCQWRWQDKGHR